MKIQSLGKSVSNQFWRLTVYSLLKWKINTYNEYNKLNYKHLNILKTPSMLLPRIVKTFF